MKRLKFLALAVVALAAMTACREGLRGSIWAPLALEQMVGDINVPDGVFSGVGTGGFAGNIYADVTIQGRAIVNIEVTGHSETPSFAASVFGSLVPTIMARQATGVDIIAGATYTAQALINAVEDALTSAGADLAALRAGPAITAPRSFVPGTYHVAAYGYNGNIGVAVVFDASRITSIAVTGHSETAMFANMAFGPMIPAMEAAQTYDVDVVAGATYTAVALREAVRIAMTRAETGAFAAPAGSGAVRVYSAAAAGYIDDVVVAVAFDGNSIVAINVTRHSETPMFANMALGPMIPAMIAAQTYDVDVVAGATYTAEALREAVRLAMEQAF